MVVKNVKSETMALMDKERLGGRDERHHRPPPRVPLLLLRRRIRIRIQGWVGGVARTRAIHLGRWVKGIVSFGLAGSCRPAIECSTLRHVPWGQPM
ncbi:hypothetical protein CMV_005927 [Castanea mollissima]|uniref:Uncharacterized protein n=1 Tax=Castanea mollissima TaxID=60419 RepID=A0A8J4VTW4_9ROSI|nr:hypothetical protein CMV_005927 [Castanea mollissima]